MALTHTTFTVERLKGEKDAVMVLSEHTLDVETGSDDEKDRICDACETDDVIRPAIKYCLDCNQAICKNCVDCHRRIKQIKDHKLVLFTNEAVKVAQFLSTCMSCPEHPDKTIELVCKDHDVMFCILCASVNHRSCRQVVDLASEAAGVNMFASKPDLMCKLDTATKHMKEIVKIHQKHNETVQAQIDVRIPLWLRKLRANVLQALTKIEETILAESRAQGQQEIYKGTAELKTWDSYIEALDDASKFLTNIQQNGSEVHAYVAINHVQRKLAEIEGKIKCQGNQLKRQSLDVKESQALHSICTGKPAELIVQHFKTKVYPLPLYNSVSLGNPNSFRQRFGNAFRQHGTQHLGDSQINQFHFQAYQVPNPYANVQSQPFGVLGLK